ncbi:MAG TPA: nickel-responsive transcriptional regulator NikR [Chthoniobacteraceae bacterium]|nr:nickel-responsive transcriptional regulator NikR [Chthoniobacteraceae bacterium]
MENEGVARLSVSLNKTLLKKLDRMVREKGYDNRSLAIAHMISDTLVEHQHDLGDIEAVGTVTLVYDHHKPRVQEALTELQHDHLHSIVSAMHVHLDHHNCLEVLVVRGRASVIQAFADRLIGIRGVKHGKLTITSTGKDLPS